MKIIFRKDEYEQLENGLFQNTNKTIYGFYYLPSGVNQNQPNYSDLEINNWTFCNDPEFAGNDEPECIVLSRQINHQIDEEGNLIITIGDRDEDYIQKWKSS